MKHRIRVVGILRRDEQILLVEQQNPNTGYRRWTPPGGGLEIGDSDIFAGVEREVFEETGLQVRAGQVRFVSEYAANTVDGPFVALSIWIECQPLDNEEFGTPSLANTLPDDHITDVKWWNRADLFGKENVSASLQKTEFWEILDLSEPRVGHLGRRTD